MNDLLRGITKKFFGRHLEFRVRLFNILAFAGTFISISMCVTGIAAHSGFVNVLLNFTAAVLSAALLWYSYTTGKYQRCYIITILGIFFGLFTLLFFSSGGYHAGMQSFFIFAVLFTVFMLEGKKMVAMSVLELILYAALCFWAYYHPEHVNEYDTEEALLLDIVVCFLIVSTTLGITMAMHFRLYNQQQKELEAARKQAEEYSRMKSELFADMSHEMRTPLTVMSAYAQYAVEQIRISGANEQTLADLATISDEAKRLAEMADGTLKILMSANEAERREAASIDIGVLVARLARLFGAIASRKGRKLTYDIKETLPPLIGDMDSLTQLLWNILQNAVTYSDGDIALIARSDGQTIQVTVKDNGAGIPPDMLPHIFDRGVSGKEGGSGIGLSLCREIARRHDGEIEVESEPGAGTSVIVTLPAFREELAND